MDDEQIKISYSDLLALLRDKVINLNNVYLLTGKGEDRGLIQYNGMRVYSTSYFTPVYGMVNITPKHVIELIRDGRTVIKKYDSTSDEGWDLVDIIVE